LHSRTNETVEAHAISGNFLKPSKIVLASGMLFSPIPPGSYDSDIYLLWYIYFSIIAILAITFIVGTILTLKHSKNRKLLGKIFVVIGIIELIPYTIAAIQIITLNLFYQLYNPYLFFFILGCITLTGGVAILKKVKQHWMYFLITATITLIIWASIVLLPRWK
jgi:hypothetical protein